MNSNKPTRASLIEVLQRRGGNGLRRLSEAAEGVGSHGHSRFTANSRAYVVGTDIEDVERGRPKGGRRTHRDPTLKVYWRDDTL